ncbi:MAG: TetR/AcrR family transcriptional regulator [Oscillospiraceae bacterium]|nr:TetR/AcrR family transcriptional regulator [Oscillospiraceae bacterium]
MDRRQRKTRRAIFDAFTDLLSRKEFGQITVEEIIRRADVGRATFYAHFETKDFLLKELCQELFCHIIDAACGQEEHHHIFECDTPAPVFLHLFSHLQKNDNHLLTLLSGENNELFLRYFKTELRRLAERQLPQFEAQKDPRLPRDFLVEHIAATFIETVRWWVKDGMRLPPETIVEYFYLAV